MRKMREQQWSDAPRNCLEIGYPKKICPNDVTFSRFLLKSGLLKLVIEVVTFYLPAS